MHLILASSSPRRRELLGSLGVPFTIHKPDIDETQAAGEAPLDYVYRLSRQKAAQVAERLGTAETVLAADTIVILSADTMGIDEGGRVLGKPADAAEAREMLRALRGRAHRVCTGLTLWRTGQTVTEITQTQVVMRDYTDAEIEAYIASGDPFDKAGSYAIQHLQFRPVARIEGCYTNVVGLPVCRVRTLLADAGFAGVLPAAVCDCPPF